MIEPAAVFRSGIVAGGNWIIDHVKLIDTWPAQDALASIVGESTGNGGSAYNILKNLARLGAGFPLEGIGLLGADDAGRSILEDCRKHGIDVSQLHITEERPTSYTDVMTEQRTSRRTFFHHRGANARLSPQHFDFSATRARIFHLGYLLLLDALDEKGADGLPRAAEVLRRARDAGLRTTVDCVSEDSDRFQTVIAPVLPHVDILFANDFEAQKLTGIAIESGGKINAKKVEAAARNLVERGVRDWVVIHFPAGACACSASGEICWQPAVNLPAAEIAGAAGAGDAFAAGVLLGLHENWPMKRSLELGVAAAAASLRHPTCSDAVGTVAEALALSAMHGFHASTVL